MTMKELSGMLIESLAERAGAVLMICAAAAAMEQFAGEKRGALAFRSVCALAVATGAYRLVARLFD